MTSAFLYYMAFVFAGKGVAELQGGGVLPTTILSWAPRMPGLGIYPTVESLLAQGVLVSLLFVALIWNFAIEPRRQNSAPALASGSRHSTPPAATPPKASLTEAPESSAQKP